MSEEMKNLNEQPNEAPVEKTEAPKLPLSKKTIGIICGAVAAVLVLVLVLVLALGGNKTPDNTPDTDDQGSTVTPDPKPETPVVTEKDYNLGMGLVFGDFKADQTNATIATVVTDKDGKIVACKIDAVQNKYKIADTVTFTILDTKKELGDKYNMAAYGTPNYGTTVLEWYKQAEVFENYVIGKTAAELKALEYQEVNNHMISKDEALLEAGCTIQIGDFVDAVVKACEDEQGMAFKTAGEIALGLGVNNSDNGTSGDDFEATVKMNIDFAATVLVDGKIVAALNDAAQPELKVEDGAVISKSVGKGADILKTKRELKEDYKMAAYGAPNVEGGTVKEWYIQSAAFSKYIVGMTPAQVAGLKTQLVNNHLISTDDALLSAGCTIQITGIVAVVAESAGYAEYTLGMGLVFGNITNAETNATIATVVLNNKGVIVACKIDAVQNKYSITENGVKLTNLLTKKELGNNYNMATYGQSMDWNGDGIVKEWFEQIAAFEAYVIGKTAAEVAAMETKVVEGSGYVISADDALLSAGCTIQIDEFKAAVVKACNDEQNTKFYANGEFTLGLGVNSADNGSTGDDFEATVKMNVDFAATVVVDGKIVAALNDAVQPQLTVEDATDVTSTSVGKGEGILQTKRELKENYKMAAYGAPNVEGGTVKEWYIQSAAFSNYIVGLTSAQVEGLETKVVNDHYISTDDALLSAGCTMQITGMQAVVVEAVANAK